MWEKSLEEQLQDPQTFLTLNNLRRIDKLLKSINSSAEQFLPRGLKEVGTDEPYSSTVSLKFEVGVFFLPDWFTYEDYIYIYIYIQTWKK